VSSRDHPVQSPGYQLFFGKRSRQRH